MNAKIKTLGFVLGATALCAAAGMAQRTSAPAETARVAHTIVTQCGNIHKGDLVLIEGGTRDQQLLEDIAVEVRKLGAHPLITIGSDQLTQRMITDVPADFDTQEQAFGMKLAETIDALISVEYGEKLDLLAGVSPERLARMAKAEHAVYEKLRERGVVSVQLGNNLYPTEARAKQFGISQPDLSRIFWNAVNTDYTAIQAIGERVQDILAAGKEVRITAPNGTDLVLQVTSRPVFVNDGIVSEEDRYAKGSSAQAWLPAGEVYLAPVPGSANGTFIADTFYYEGKLIEGLKLVFKDGKLTSLTANPKSDISLLEKRRQAAPAPGRDQFAAIDIGINPALEVPKNGRFVSWIASGTISVGFGGNTWAGGENDVPFDVSAHLPNGTLTVDGRKLIDQGKLIAEK